VSVVSEVKAVVVVAFSDVDESVVIA